MSQGEKRPYAQAFATATRILEGIMPYCDRVVMGGSLRRGRPMIGDIEIVALPRRQTDLLGNVITSGVTQLELFLKARVRLLKNGDKFKQFRYDGFTVDLFLPETPAHWGTVLLIRTGSAEFNMWLMTEQQKRAGVQFANGRLLDWQGRFIDTSEEAAVFEALGLPFIPPQDRQDKKWLAHLGVNHG